MKGSTFAIAIGTMLVAIAPVGVVNPAGYGEALTDLLGQAPLIHAVAVAWLVTGVLVLMQPAPSRSLDQRFVRAVAWLTAVTSLAMLWIPALVTNVTGWIASLPGWVMRLGSLSDFAFGVIMLWIGRGLIQTDSDKEDVLDK